MIQIILQESCKRKCNIIFLQGILFLARNNSFLVQDLQDMCKILMQDLPTLARKIIARLAYFLQVRFFWVLILVGEISWTGLRIDFLMNSEVDHFMAHVIKFERDWLLKSSFQ